MRILAFEARRWLVIFEVECGRDYNSMGSLVWEVEDVSTTRLEVVLYSVLFFVWQSWLYIIRPGGSEINSGQMLKQGTLHVCSCTGIIRTRTLSIRKRISI